MDEKILKYSHDALQAMGKITLFAEGKTFEEYKKMIFFVLPLKDNLKF